MISYAHIRFCELYTPTWFAEQPDSGLDNLQPNRSIFIIFIHSWKVIWQYGGIPPWNSTGILHSNSSNPVNDKPCQALNGTVTHMLESYMAELYGGFPPRNSTGILHLDSSTPVNVQALNDCSTISSTINSPLLLLVRFLPIRNGSGLSILVLNSSIWILWISIDWAREVFGCSANHVGVYSSQNLVWA